jgi:ubiquinol-cytochrome c reductase iron-sulfur subunit
MPVTPAERARRRFLLRVTTGLGGLYTLAAAYPFLDSFMPSARARAEGAPVEADLNGIGPGEMQTVAWRGKPVWILRRTPEMIAGLSRHDDLLADPQSKQSSQQPDDCRNAARSIQPEWFVCIGICTHLGCSPSLREQLPPAHEDGVTFEAEFDNSEGQATVASVKIPFRVK